MEERRRSWVGHKYEAKGSHIFLWFHHISLCMYSVENLDVSVDNSPRSSFLNWAVPDIFEAWL